MRQETLTKSREELLSGERCDWITHNRLYIESLPLLLLRLRFAREKWLRRVWRVLARQWGESSAARLAIHMTSSLFEKECDPNSLIYLGFAMSTKRPYVGMVEGRNPMSRFQEHFAAICRHRHKQVDEVDPKYSYMARSGVGDWFFLPIVVCDGIIPKQRLLQLEKIVLSHYPNALNKVSRLQWLKYAPRPNPDRSRHHYPGHLTDYDLPGSLAAAKVITKIGFVDPGGGIRQTSDPAEAFGQDLILFHSDYPWNLQTVIRQHRDSILRADILLQPDNPVIDRLPAVLKRLKQESWGWTLLTFVHRDPKELSRPEDYDYLLQILRHEVDRAEADDLLVQDLWRMWGISAREIEPSAPKTHQKNTKFIARELRRRGITLRPDRNVVVRLPCSSTVRKKDIQECFKTALVKTYLPLCVCDHILNHMTIIWSGPDKLGASLDNGKLWARRINDNIPIRCNCSLFPDLPTRHGHVYCPSWEYNGEFAATVRANMRSHIGTGDDWVEIDNVLKKVWLRYLPHWSCPDTLRPFGSGRVQPTAEEFRPDVVRRCRSLLAPLAVTAVDKQASALLLQ